MTTPFVAFRTPDVAPSSHPETLALGLGLGALLGATIPALSLTAELLAGGGLAVFAASPGLLATLIVPCVTGALGAWAWPLLHAHRSAYDVVAEKAGTLLDETWELRGQLDLLSDAPALRHDLRSELEPDDTWHGMGDEPTEEMLIRASTSRPGFQAPSPSEEEALIEAQGQLLHSIGSATRDTARRMQVSLRGLAFTPLTAVQERLVHALTGHLDGLRDLADEVVSYAEEEPEPLVQTQSRSGRVRAAA